jgi:hypothetical protein
MDKVDEILERRRLRLQARQASEPAENRKPAPHRRGFEVVERHYATCPACGTQHIVSGPDVVLTPEDCPQRQWTTADVLRAGERIGL